MSDKYVGVFGEHEKSLVDRVPQIKHDDVNPDANALNFICYCAQKGMSPSEIAQRSEFNKKEIEELIAEAKSLELYNSLAKSFLR